MKERSRLGRESDVTVDYGAGKTSQAEWWRDGIHKRSFALGKSSGALGACIAERKVKGLDLQNLDSPSETHVSVRATGLPVASVQLP